MKCDKIHYKNFDSAYRAYKKYHKDIIFSSMSVYFCKIHKCYHLGHDKYASNKKIISINKIEFDFDLIMNNLVLDT